MNATTYQRIRLWAGITSIGTNLGLIWGCALLAGLVGDRIPDGLAWWVLVGVAVGIALANLPFEILVGHAVETGLGRETRPLKVWLRDWWREKVPVTAATAVGFVVIGLMSQMDWAMVLGMAGVLVAAGVVLVDASAGRPGSLPEGSWEDELRSRGLGDVRLRWFEGDATARLNGFTLPWRPRTVFLSRSCLDELTPGELAALIFREQALSKKGIPLASATIAVVWCLAGVGLALAFPASGVVSAALGGAAMVSTWAFLALFVWPALNRRWMREGDRVLVECLGPEAARALLKRIQTVNGTDTNLPAAKTAVFHPIPPLEDRLAQIP